jgi:hypothetical protein
MLAVLAMGVALAQAQQKIRGPSPQMVEEIATELQLDDTQKNELKRVFEQQRQKMEQMREERKASGERPDREEMKAHREKMHQELVTEVRTFLTAEQVEKFEQIMAERRARGPGERRKQLAQ